MEEQKDTNSEKKFEDMFSDMGNYMVHKLEIRIENIKKRLEEVGKSDRKNKEEVLRKLEELISVMDKMTEKTKLQTKTQKEILDLMESMSKLDDEIDDLLIKDGS